MSVDRRARILGVCEPFDTPLYRFAVYSAVPIFAQEVSYIFRILLVLRLVSMQSGNVFFKKFTVQTITPNEAYNNRRNNAQSNVMPIDNSRLYML